MDDSMRSASLGPPKRVARASGLKPRFAGGAASGSLVVVVVEFSTLHFKREFMPGSMVDGVLVLEGGGRFANVNVL